MTVVVIFRDQNFLNLNGLDSLTSGSKNMFPITNNIVRVEVHGVRMSKKGLVKNLGINTQAVKFKSSWQDSALYTWMDVS